MLEGLHCIRFSTYQVGANYSCLVLPVEEHVLLLVSFAAANGNALGTYYYVSGSDDDVLVVVFKSVFRGAVV